MRAFLKNAFPSFRRQMGMQSQLRRDQLAMMRYFITAAFLIFAWILFRNDWPQGMVVGLLGILLLCLMAGSFFMGRFLRGQQWIMDQPAASSADFAAGSAPMVQAYVSLEEARDIGWNFFEQVGRYGAWPIPRWAHDGEAWYEYRGLDGGASLRLRPDERVFGLFVYRLVPLDQTPNHPAPWIPVQPSTPA